MFRETDETVTEPQFVNLSYIQAQHDYLQVRRGAGLGCDGWGDGRQLQSCRLCAAAHCWLGLEQEDGIRACIASRKTLPPRSLQPFTSLPTFPPFGKQGQYPVIREDAAQMCALQMQAEHGPTLASDSAGFEAALEKYMVKQVHRLGGVVAAGSGKVCLV